MRAPYSRTLFDLLAERAERSPGALAAVAGDRAATFAELHAGARRVASGLRRAGIRHGDRVGAFLSNRLEWLELAFGAGGAGAVFVPFSTWSTPPELRFLIADSGIRLLVAPARLEGRDVAADLLALAPEVAEGGAAPGFPALERILLVDAAPGDRFGRYGALADGPDDLGEPPPGERAGALDDGLVLYTSGSSANPKAVRLRQAGIVENGFNIGERMGLGPADRVLLPAPLFWSYGSANALPAAFTHGAALVLQERFAAGGAIDLVERHGCTAIYTLPGMTAAILRDPGFAPERLKSLRTGLTIGSPQDVLTAARGLGAAELCNIYGATETYGNCCVSPHHWPLERRALCQGAPLPGNALRFVDVETGAPAGTGEPGLVEVRGYTTPGYSGASADGNGQAFTADGFYRTGDVGRLDADGAFVFVGRNTEMIKRAGINVSPAEVENVLMLHAGVAQAGVVGVPDAERGELIVAFVVPGAEPVTAEALVAHCRAVASKYKVPDRIEIRPALPLTPTGKLQRRALKGDAADLVAGRAPRG